ncbi:MAG: hypothetical protein KDA24_23935 [Deltaproteobacteria bacterium]|nr:hypothetical protein [Deltaproteobacteria bacterium]
MRIKLLLPLLAALFLVVPSTAKADVDPNPLFLALGGLKTPGIAFDVVGAAFVRPHLEVFESGTRMHRATRAAFASHLVSVGLHSLSVGSFFAGAFADDWEDAIGPVFLINGVCDITIGIMGLVTGIDILLAKSTVDVKGTEAGIGSTWSGVVNISMGLFGVAWFAPMLIGGLIGVSEMAVVDPAEQRIALRARKVKVRAAVVPSVGGLAVVGRF